MAVSRRICAVLPALAVLGTLAHCGDADDDDAGATGSAGTAVAAGASGGGEGAQGGQGGTAGSASGASGAGSGTVGGTGATSAGASGSTDADTGCIGADVALNTPVMVDGSGLSGSIASLSLEQKQAFCDWLWALPGYGQQYCCPGVVRPLRASVDDEESEQGCVAFLSELDACPQVAIDAFESCALDRIAHYCSTPAGCFAFGHGGLTSTCLSEADAGR